MLEMKPPQEATGDKVPPDTGVAAPVTTLQYVIKARKSGMDLLNEDQAKRGIVPVEFTIHAGEFVWQEEFEMHVWDFDIWVDAHIKAVGVIPNYAVKVEVT